jgi:ABC-type sulfate/molybdate transport systems ATPase subunit
MIEARNLVKRYGSTMAVNDLSFSIRPGMVTGFLGPNGAGKTTTMRMILGLDAPTQGSVTVAGRSYRDLPAPMREVGPAAAIACMMAVLLVLPGIAQALPGSWRNPVNEFWPTQAGSQLTSVHHSAHTLQPWPGFGVMCLFVAIVYAIAWTLLDRRDA